MNSGYEKNDLRSRNKTAVKLPKARNKSGLVEMLPCQQALRKSTARETGNEADVLCKE